MTKHVTVGVKLISRDDLFKTGHASIALTRHLITRYKIAATILLTR